MLYHGIYGPSSSNQHHKLHPAVTLLPPVRELVRLAVQAGTFNPSFSADTLDLERECVQHTLSILANGMFNKPGSAHPTWGSGVSIRRVDTALNSLGENKMEMVAELIQEGTHAQHLLPGYQALLTFLVYNEHASERQSKVALHQLEQPYALDLWRIQAEMFQRYYQFDTQALLEFSALYGYWCHTMLEHYYNGRCADAQQFYRKRYEDLRSAIQHSRNQLHQVQERMYQLATGYVKAYMSEGQATPETQRLRGEYQQTARLLLRKLQPIPGFIEDTALSMGGMTLREAFEHIPPDLRRSFSPHSDRDFPEDADCMMNALYQRYQQGERLPRRSVDRLHQELVRQHTSMGCPLYMVPAEFYRSHLARDLTIEFEKHAVNYTPTLSINTLLAYHHLMDPNKTLLDVRTAYIPKSA